MAAPQRYLTSLPRSLLSPFSQPVRPHSSVLTFLYPSQQQSRGARIKTKSNAKDKAKKKRPFFRQYDMKDAVQFTLCDAMRYVFVYNFVSGPYLFFFFFLTGLSILTQLLATDISAHSKQAENSNPSNMKSI